MVKLVLVGCLLAEDLFGDLLDFLESFLEVTPVEALVHLLEDLVEALVDVLDDLRISKNDARLYKHRAFMISK